MDSRIVLEGEVTKRPPKGYDPDHRFIDDLKRKDFITTVSFKTTHCMQPGVPHELRRVLQVDDALNEVSD